MKAHPGRLSNGVKSEEVKAYISHEPYQVIHTQQTEMSISVLCIMYTCCGNHEKMEHACMNGAHTPLAVCYMHTCQGGANLVPSFVQTLMLEFQLKKEL